MLNLKVNKEKAKAKLLEQKEFPVALEPLHKEKTFNQIFYRDDLHKYSNTVTTENYISVTTLLGRLEEKVYYPTTSTELRLGLTKEEVYLFWTQKNRWAKGRGSFVHNWIERRACRDYSREEYVYQQLNFLDDSQRKEYLNYIYLAMERVNILSKKYQVHIEKLLGCHTFKLAGQADLIAENDTCFYIEDWKTNDKDLSVDDSYGKTLFDNPLTTLYKYILQLSIYAYLYENISKKECKGLFIHHLYQGKMKTYSFPYNRTFTLKVIKELKYGLHTNAT